VFDVVGAGDTGIATLALVLGAGEDLVSAARLANTAAGLVVGKQGTATVSASELEQELAWLGRGTLTAFGDKILSRDRLLSKVSVWRRDGLRIGFTNGCFDLLHVGQEATPLDRITELSPDVLVKGADYRMNQIVGADVVIAAGGRVLTCDNVSGKSMTSIVSAISAG
jgi:bifunctional ADP-heptose synthase (sugar kinase/adenylyltransferase)